MHKARRRFGQNFLQDKNVIDGIISLINPVDDDCILEIGPGLGALTKALLDKINILYAIEIDRDLATKLTINYKRLHLYQADALKFDLGQIPCAKKIRLVGNLPYNISTPILFHFLKQQTKIIDMHFMLQKELVERIVSPPDNKVYGRLSVMLQTFCEVEKLMEIPPSAFIPKPKVDSAIIRIVPKPKPNLIDTEKFSTFIRTAFNHRRKTLRNNLKTIIPIKQLTSAPFDLSLRAENIKVPEYMILYKWYDTLKL